MEGDLIDNRYITT